MIDEKEFRAMAVAAGDKPISCLVPFCKGRSWKYRHSTEYLCSKHYKIVDADLRIQHNAFGRLIRKCIATGYSYTEADRLDRIVWEKVRAQALERAN